MTLIPQNQANRGDYHHVYQEFQIINQVIAGGASVSQTHGSTDVVATTWWCNVSAITGAPVITFSIIGQTYENIGYNWTILQSVPIVATGIYVMRVFPGATPAANLTANDWLPSRFRFTADVVGGGTDATIRVIEMTWAPN